MSSEFGTEWLVLQDPLSWNWKQGRLSEEFSHIKFIITSIEDLSVIKSQKIVN